ncbi:MAG TPA: rhomboid family intramembrane serine protease [Aquifex aeolicus]|nr:rhomboid family intramembrane serine protease [Aquifex aeolicus]
MIPIKDINPSRSFPIVNITIIFLCSVIWLYEWSLTKNIIYTIQGTMTKFEIFLSQWGLVPAELLEKPYTLITHMFLHGGWGHIIGNMWFLWVFGDNVEDKLGKLRYIVFYILCGLGAALTQTLISFSFGGTDVPMVGASGAISGVLGAYMKMFPNARILALVPIFIFFTLMELPALIFIGIWFFIQIVNGIVTLPFIGYGGVAWYAHIGGFLTGYLLIDFFYKRKAYYY